jgi:tetratricopeptide (TPR) repeat protein
MQTYAFKVWSDGKAEAAIAVLDRLLQYEPDAALAYYYKGVFQSRQDQNEEALTSFQDSLSAELRRDVPDRLNLRQFREKVRKTEDAITSPGDESK